jgi:predicted SnoaL-like aldol condensation-catalyzing enzyme
VCSSRQHNPYTLAGMAELFEAMAHPNLSIKNLVAEGDLVISHTDLLFSKSDPKKGGLRQAHVFRFGPNNKIVEYWDITQMIQQDMHNAGNAF